jgi:serine phosphatase RsbU (regulator of sigma subunit)
MQLDSEIQKNQLLQVIDQTNLNGVFANLMPSIQALANLRQQVEQAEILKTVLKAVE